MGRCFGAVWVEGEWDWDLGRGEVWYEERGMIYG